MGDRSAIFILGGQVSFVCCIRSSSSSSWPSRPSPAPHLPRNCAISPQLRPPSAPSDPWTVLNTVRWTSREPTGSTSSSILIYYILTIHIIASLRNRGYWRAPKSLTPILPIVAQRGHTPGLKPHTNCRTYSRIFFLFVRAIRTHIFVPPLPGLVCRPPRTDLPDLRPGLQWRQHDDLPSARMVRDARKPGASPLDKNSRRV